MGKKNTNTATPTSGADGAAAAGADAAGAPPAPTFDGEATQTPAGDAGAPPAASEGEAAQPTSEGDSTSLPAGEGEEPATDPAGDPAPSTERAEKKCRAAVLVDCYLGKIGDIVELDGKAARAAVDGGYIDPHPSAVAAAEAARA